MDSNTILLISNGLLVVITATLVLVTWKYTYHTKRMADVMMKDHELKIKPLIEVELEDGIYTEKDFERTIFIKNIGENKIYIKNKTTYVSTRAASGQPIKHLVSKYNDLDEVHPKNTEFYRIYVGFKEINKLPIKNLFTGSDPDRVKDLLESKKIKVELSPNLKYPNFNVSYSLDIAGPDFNFITKELSVL